MREQRPVKRVAIVGAGFSGTATALELARLAERYRQRVEIVLIEQRPDRRSGGVAYSKSDAGEEHVTNIEIDRLNLPGAQRLSRWLNNDRIRDDWPPALQTRFRNRYFDEGEPCPRQLYQLYLDYHLQQEARSNSYATIREIDGRVLDVHPTRRLVNLDIDLAQADGSSRRDRLLANFTVMATGNTEPKQAPFMRDSALQASALCETDQWSSDSKEKRDSFLHASTKDSKVLIVGTALSGYDAALSLIERGYKGKIVMTSRHGMEHFPYRPHHYQRHRFVHLVGIDAIEHASRSRSLPHTIDALALMFHRTMARDPSTTSEDVLQALQEYVPQIIENFGNSRRTEVQKALRDYGSLITTLRVGVSYQVASRIQEAKANGQLEVVPAEISSMYLRDGKVEVNWTPADKTTSEVATFDYTMSCIGRTFRGDLWEKMEAKGLWEPHPLGDGIRVSAQGEVLKPHSVLHFGREQAQPNLFAIGTMRGSDSAVRRGMFGPPTYAIPGIVPQIRPAVNRIIERLDRAQPIPSTQLSEVIRSAMHSPNRRQRVAQRENEHSRPQQPERWSR